MRRAFFMAATIAISACSAESVVVSDAARTVELSGGPASISSTAEGIEYHQTKADELCRQKGFARAQSAGTKEDLFVTSYLYSCVD